MAAEKSTIIRARDIMSKGIVSIDGMDTAQKAAAKMREKKVSALLVNKRHADDAWGIIAVQDLIRGMIVPGRPPEEVNVYEIMTKPVITVAADMDVRYVARLLYRIGIRRAPVEEEGELLGMVALSSLILDNNLFS
ncbi:MAG: CBS domain-containing protein [Thermodesulfobacteriota bacterium]